jgi:phage recombination protein Bet
MSTQAIAKTNPPPQKPSALSLMASRLSVEPTKLLDTLKSTVFKNATNEELLALVVVSNEYGLSPFLKEIYAFPAKGGGIVPIVSIDGWNKMLIRHPEFDGITFEFSETPEGELVSCTATVHMKNRSHPVVITEYLGECKRNTDPWNNMPHRMLRNRTLCQAARIACGFSGIYDEDEAATIVTVDAAIVTSAPKPAMITDVQAESAAGLAPVEVGKPGAATGPQADLEKLVTDNGYKLDTLLKWGEQTGNIPDGTSLTSFAEIPADVAKRLLRAKVGLLSGLKQAAGL